MTEQQCQVLIEHNDGFSGVGTACVYVYIYITYRNTMYMSMTAANAHTMNTQPIEDVTVATVLMAPTINVGVNPRAGLGVGGGMVSGAVDVVVVVVAAIIIITSYCTHL